MCLVRRAVAVGALQQGGNVQAVRIVQAAERVADGHYFRAHLVKNTRRHAADIAEALHGNS